MAIKHTFLGKKGLETKTLSPLQAIRQKCLECSNWSSTEVSKCNVKDCAIYPYRSGKSGKVRTLTETQRKVLSKRMKKIHTLKSQSILKN